MTILLLPLLGGCSLPGEAEGCTKEARSSVTVTVVDDAGAPVEGAAVTWASPEGGGGDCDAVADATWACGWEQRGEITVTAGAPGHTPAEATVVVGGDACHVVAEQVTLVLAPLDCTAVEVPAVELWVSASTGGPVGEAIAYYVPSDEDWSSPGVCDIGLDGIYWCAWERSGDLDVWVHAPGWSAWAETISVGHDGCHPITELREVVLTPM